MASKWLGVHTAVVLIAAWGGAGATTVPFTIAAGTTYYQSATGGSGLIPAGGVSPLLRTQGDYITQTVSGSSLHIINGYSVMFQFRDFVRYPAFQVLDISLNGVDLGAFQQPSCDQVCGGVESFGITSGGVPIYNGQGDFTFKYVLENTIAGSDSGFAFLDGGSGSLSFDAVVPEPAAWAVMIVGLGMVGLAVRRRKALATAA